MKTFAENVEELEANIYELKGRMDIEADLREILVSALTNLKEMAERLAGVKA